MIAQTSNDHLDELNARAQAIRRQHRELSDDSLEIPGRPYQLHAGDHIQIRHTINHPERGQLRNGTIAKITRVDPRSQELELRVSVGAEVRLDRQQIADADLRLAYVQHPFPAQGQTTDTAHLIVAGHGTREGTYVALTRAREQTNIYATDTAELDECAQLQDLAERVSRTEPEVPSIRTPLAQESEILASVERSGIDERDGRSALVVEPDLATVPETSGVLGETPTRAWPRRNSHEIETTERVIDQGLPRETLGWER